MTELPPRLALLTPHGVDAASAERLYEAIAAACGGADVAAVILRLAPADPRSLVCLVKALVPAGQQRGAAMLVCCPDADDLPGIAARGGADGVHADKAGEAALREMRPRLRDGRILGAGGMLDSKHAAMSAGEAGVDYVMFGGLYPDGAAPDHERVCERAAWWAEIFETPCIAVATDERQLPALARTRAEFVALESALWCDDPAALVRAQAALADRSPA